MSSPRIKITLVNELPINFNLLDLLHVVPYPMPAFVTALKSENTTLVTIIAFIDSGIDAPPIIKEKLFEPSGNPPQSDGLELKIEYASSNQTPSSYSTWMIEYEYNNTEYPNTTFICTLLSNTVSPTLGGIQISETPETSRGTYTSVYKPG